MNYFIVEQKKSLTTLYGPISQQNVEEGADLKAWDSFALVKKDKLKWVQLKDFRNSDSANFSATIEGNFQGLTALCNDEKLEANSWMFQIEGTGLGPLAASEMKYLNFSELKGKNIFLRNNVWHSWLLVKNADWILGLWKQGTLPSEDAREKEKVFSKQVEVDSNLRNAQRKTVLGTAWWAKVSSPVEAVGACVDLSETGAQLFFEGNLDFKIGEELLLSLRPAKVVTLDDLDLLMELKSRVMWIDVGARKLGVQFLDLSSDRAEKLKHLLERLSNA